MSLRGNCTKIASCQHCSHFKIIINLVEILSKWKILSNSAKKKKKKKKICLFVCFFHSVYKTNIDCFLFGAQFRIIGPWWCQNHDYARSKAEGIVIVWYHWGPIIITVPLIAVNIWRSCFRNLLHPLRHVTHLHYWLPFVIKIVRLMTYVPIVDNFHLTYSTMCTMIKSEN